MTSVHRGYPVAKLIGTAGHVDHGKTTLIRALTGIDADRLPEEKERGMTIDIGFAYIDFPTHGRVSIVDVPGHEKFIANMLVGALGMDVALLCVAADEGVKPQTREHLQILELLPVEKLVVALTRADLADPDTRELCQLEVTDLLEPTRFKDSPVLAVSAETGEGLVELKDQLSNALHATATNKSAPWYLPIDRVFAVKGHGCVVTGTLARGNVQAGSEATIQPGGRTVRIRGIHSHGEESQSGDPGRRTALNLGGVKVEEIHRGQAIGAPGALFETTMFDARLRWIHPLRKHGMRVRVSIGSEEAIAKAFFSDTDPEIVQFRLDHPTAVALDQPLIVRRYSPPDLLGGGRVVVPMGTRRRKSEEVKVVSGVADDDAILTLLDASPKGVTTEEICRQLGKSAQQLGDVLENLTKKNKVRGFAGLWFSPEGLSAGEQQFVAALQQLHDRNPEVAYQPREKVVSQAKLTWAGKPLDRILSAMATDGKVEVSGTSVKLPTFRLKLSEKQRGFLDRVVSTLEAAGVNVPPPGDLARAVHVPPQAIDEILRLGIEAGEIVRVAEGLYYSAKQIEEIKAKLREFAKGGKFAAADFRDAIGTSRKYIIPLLEYFDAIRFTLRVGDHRVIRN